MNRFHAVLLTLVSLAAAPCAGQNVNNRPVAPAVPPTASEIDKKALTQAALLITQGKFADATAALKPVAPASPAKVYVDLTPLPAELKSSYQSAVSAALAGWNSALGKTARFNTADRADEADVLVLFERHSAQLFGGQLRGICGETQVDINTGRRIARVYVGIFAAGTPTPHSPASIQHLVAHGLGEYLGLSSSEDPAGVMGPDSDVAPAAGKPTATEIATAQALDQARLSLLDFARLKVAIYVPKPTIVFDKIELDAGDVWRGDKPHFVFNVKNTGDAPLEIFAKPNCGCTVAKFDKLIQPGGSGKIEADLNTVAFRGKITKTIQVTSNDPANLNSVARMVANVKSIIAILPTEFPNLALKIGQPTVQELEVALTDTSPVELTRVVASVPYVQVSYQPKEGAPGHYMVKLSVQPEAPMGRSGFALMATTSSKREPDFTLTCMCEKGILTTPPSGYLGNINPTTPMPVNQVITLSRREGAFHIKQASSDDANLQVKTETTQDGKQYKITLTYKGGWPAGLVRHKVMVETDDPDQPMIEIPVMASISASSPAAAGSK